MKQRKRDDDLKSYKKLKEDTPTMEAYRILRTNIEFSRSINTLKTILITSSILGEGKSTTVSNLAQTFAMSGSKTLIIDLDLRRPVQHRIFSADNKEGLIDLLMGKITTEEAIKTTDVDNLYLLNCGVRPPNPAEVLASESLTKLITELRDVFDIIIIDTPPAAVLADAAIISRFSDAALLVVSSGEVDIDDVKSAILNLKNAGANILGVVMNNITKKTRGYKYYDYYYY